MFTTRKPQRTITLVRCFLFCWIAVVACRPLMLAQTPFEYEAALQKATSKLQSGVPEEALRHAEQAMNLDFARWEAYAIAGQAFMKLNRYQEAVNTLDKAIERAPEKKQEQLRELRVQCLVNESTSNPQPAPTPSSVAGSQAGHLNGTLKTSSDDRLNVVKDHQKQPPTMKGVSNAGAKAIFFVCYARSRSGVCESVGQLTIKTGGLSYNSRTRNQSLSGGCSDITDLSTFIPQPKAAPSFRASVTEGIALRVLGREAVFFVNPNATAEDTDSVDAIVDKIKLQCPDVESKR
jgi:hypothetical protein